MPRRYKQCCSSPWEYEMPEIEVFGALGPCNRRSAIIRAYALVPLSKLYQHQIGVLKKEQRRSFLLPSRASAPALRLCVHQTRTDQIVKLMILTLLPLFEEPTEHRPLSLNLLNRHEWSVASLIVSFAGSLPDSDTLDF